MILPISMTLYRNNYFTTNMNRSNKVKRNVYCNYANSVSFGNQSLLDAATREVKQIDYTVLKHDAMTLCKKHNKLRKRELYLRLIAVNKLKMISKQIGDIMTDNGFIPAAFESGNLEANATQIKHFKELLQSKGKELDNYNVLTLRSEKHPDTTLDIYYRIDGPYEHLYSLGIKSLNSKKFSLINKKARVREDEGLDMLFEDKGLISGCGQNFGKEYPNGVSIHRCQYSNLTDKRDNIKCFYDEDSLFKLWKMELLDDNVSYLLDYGTNQIIRELPDKNVCIEYDFKEKWTSLRKIIITEIKSEK